MMKRPLFVILPCIACCVPCDVSVGNPPHGPLAEYVARPDNSYAWAKRAEGRVGNTEVVELRLVSQTWRDIVWKHQLFVIKPSTASRENKHGVLVIAGSRWRNEYDDPATRLKLPAEAALYAGIAESFKCPLAVLLQVPYQPIFGDRVEDDAIAYTFDQFLKTGDPEWPLLLPMVKSAVRAADAVGEFCHQQWEIDLDQYTLVGASKRGWTTWLTASVDGRVAAIAPMVFDTLNLASQMRHQRDVWGNYSEKIKDYTSRRLPQRLDTDAGRKLQRIVDPYAYRERISQPKLLILGTNDPYWPLDALNLYWDGLVGPKYIFYVPNGRHGLSDYPSIIGSIQALHRQAVGSQMMPEMTWEYTRTEQGLILRIESDVKPSRVRIWRAASATRDFRRSRWTATPAKHRDDVYEHRLWPDDTDFVAFFGEAKFDTGLLPLRLSTRVHIMKPVPDD